MHFSIHWAKGDSGPWNISCVFLFYHYRCINFMASNQPVSRAAPCLADLSIQQWHKQLCAWLARYSQLFSACGLANNRNAIHLLYLASLCAFSMILHEVQRNHHSCFYWKQICLCVELLGSQPPIQWVPGLSRGLKRPGRGVEHPPPPSAEVQEKVELYLYSISGLSWPVYGVNFYC